MTNAMCTQQRKHFDLGEKNHRFQLRERKNEKQKHLKINALQGGGERNPWKSRIEYMKKGQEHLETRNRSGNRERENVSKCGKVPTTAVGNTKYN